MSPCSVIRVCCLGTLPLSSNSSKPKSFPSRAISPPTNVRLIPSVPVMDESKTPQKKPGSTGGQGQHLRAQAQPSAAFVPSRPSKPKRGLNVQPPASAPAVDEMWETLPLSGRDSVQYIKEHGSVTHMLFQGQQFEVLNVKGDGNCFYRMISVGLAFNNVFVSSKRVKQDIFAHMQDLWEAKVEWFSELFNHFVPKPSAKTSKGT